jgi:hypothetical protein
MNGFVFKTTATAFVLLTSAPVIASKATIYDAKLGCMACHRGVSIPSDGFKNNQAKRIIPKEVHKIENRQ